MDGFTASEDEQIAYRGGTASRNWSPGFEPIHVYTPPSTLSRLRVFCLNIAWYGLSTAYLCMTVVVVPAQIESMVGSKSKGRWLGGMVAGGAVLMFITGPLVGMLSDRSTSRFGRRRPVIFGATIFFCIGLMGMALMCPTVRTKRHQNGKGECEVDLVEQRCRPYITNNASSIIYTDSTNHTIDLPLLKEEESSRHIAFFILFSLMTAVSYTAATVPLSGLVADKSHPAQRGFNSGVLGFMLLSGNITGAGLGLFFVQVGVVGLYSIMAAVALTCVCFTVLTTPEQPGKRSHVPLDFCGIFHGFWEPLKERDFRWVFITRFLMQQGVATITGFLEYWLSDMIVLPHCWSPERSVAMMMIPLLGTAAIGCLVCGYLSDMLTERKRLVTISAFAMCGVATVLAFIRGEYAYYAAIGLSFICGVGFGCFQGVDFALVMDVLPDEKDKAKDIAVWHQALILPQAIATPVGGILLDVFESVNCRIGLGYIVVFLITAIYFFLSGIFIRNIKGVR